MAEDLRTPVIGDLYVNTIYRERYEHLMMVYDFDDYDLTIPDGSGYFIRLIYCESVKQTPRHGYNEYNYNIKTYSTSAMGIILVKHISDVTFTDRIHYSWKLGSLEQWCDNNGVQR